MAQLVPVDNDPFAAGPASQPAGAAAQAGAPKLVPVDHDPFAQAADSQPSPLMDIAKSGLSGVRQGVEAGLGAFGDVGKYQGDIAQWAAGKLGASPDMQAAIGHYAGMATPFPFARTTDELQGATKEAIGDPYKPQTTAGQYAHTIGEFVPAALIPGGEASLPQRLLTQAILPGAGSEAAGQIAQKVLPSSEPYMRVVGALVGGSLPTVASRAISPFASTPEREQLAQTLMGEGVDLTAGQRTGNNMLRYAESELGGGTAAHMMDNQGEQFTAAALQRAGIDANRATPEVIDGAFNRIGQQFDDLASRNRLVPDQQMIGDLRNTINEYGNLVPESARAPIVENLTNDIVNTIRQNGGIPGDSYQSLTSRIARAARTTKDPELGTALRGIRETLDDAMERSIQATNPDDAGAWQQTRNQYRNLMVLEKAATGAGENAASGLISPAALRNATVNQSRRAYARGQGDFADLARAGEGIMKPLPNSGTASRTAVRGAFSTLGGIAGAAGGGGLPGVGIGSLAGAIIPPLAGRAILSGPGRAYLGNQMAAGLDASSNPRIAAIVAALLNSGDMRKQITGP